VAAIENEIAAARLEMRQRQNMRLHQVADMDIVAHAGSIGGRIVFAEYAQFGQHADRDLNRRLIRWLGFSGFRPHGPGDRRPIR